MQKLSNKIRLELHYDISNVIKSNFSSTIVKKMYKAQFFWSDYLFFSYHKFITLWSEIGKKMLVIADIS